MSEWKDITSYSRGQIEREPQTWEIRDKKYSVRVIVTRLHGCVGWYLSCEPFFERQQLHSADEFGAKQEALLNCVAAFDQAHNFLLNIMGQEHLEES